MNPVIEFKKVSKSYIEGTEEHFVLNNVNLSISNGEIIILLGRSGSGKSTFLNLLSGIDTSNTGEIIIDGIDTNKMNERDRTLFRRNKIGFVFQFFNLIPTLTVSENILLPLELTNNLNKDTRIMALDMLEYVGLNDRLKSYPDVLSGGEQQRIAIVRALIHDPEIILADEPTGNLDFETGTKVLELLDSLVKQKGKTMIMATHSRDLTGMADRIFNISKGIMNEVTENGKLN